MKFQIFGYVIDIEKKALQEKEEMPKDLQWALEVLEKYGAKIPPSEKKKESAKRASKIKADRAKEKIQNAINLLRLQGQPINAYQVAKLSGVAYNTAKKYLGNQERYNAED